MLIQKFEEMHKRKEAESDRNLTSGKKIIDMADRIMIIDDGEIKKKLGKREDVLPYRTEFKKCHNCAENRERRA